MHIYEYLCACVCISVHSFIAFYFICALCDGDGGWCGSRPSVRGNGMPPTPRGPVCSLCPRKPSGSPFAGEPGLPGSPRPVPLPMSRGLGVPRGLAWAGSLVGAGCGAHACRAPAAAPAPPPRSRAVCPCRRICQRRRAEPDP